MSVNDVLKKRKDASISKSILLIKILGLKPIETINTDLINDLSKKELYELYWYAKINKIGFTYLKALEKANVLKKYPELEGELKRQEEVYKKHIKSIKIIDEDLTELGIEHVFIKTVYDFPVLPSDIDVLIRDRLSNELIYSLRKKGYIPFDRGPHFVSIHNIHVDPLTPRDKMSYDIDIYDEISLNYIVYLSKEHCFDSALLNNSIKIKVPPPEYELLIHINHSIFEHLFTLLHFYIFLRSLNTIDIFKLIKLTKITQSETALYYAVIITLDIINKSGLNVKRGLLEILRRYVNGIGKEILHVDELPYRFSITQILHVLLEKVKNRQYRHGFLNFVFNTSYPKQTRHIVEQILSRRRRLTY
jgi:hypothetical protein